MANLKLLIFAKKRTAKDGKTFYNYLTTLTRKSTGEAVPTQVKFRMDCGAPDPHNCPRYIIVDRSACNFSTKEIATDDGAKKCNTLWVSDWSDGGDYVDTSLEDIDTV